MLPVSDFKVPKRDKFNLIGKVKLQVLFVVGFTTFALFFVQLVFANNLATDGERLSQINDEIQKIEAENTTLKVQISQVSSLTGLSAKAHQLGYSQAKVVTGP